jgi:hypothetical protein
MDSLYCTDTRESYIRAAGFEAENYRGGTFANGVVHIRELFDESHFERIVAFNATGNAMVVNHVCCGTEFNNIQAGSDYGPKGGVPFSITNSVAVAINNSTFNFAGIGHPNVSVGEGNAALTFVNDYMEALGTDRTTPIVHIDPKASYIYFLGGLINRTAPPGVAEGTPPKPFFDNTATRGFTALGPAVGDNFVKNINADVLSIGSHLNVRGVITFAGPNTTGAGKASLGSNCPAVNCAAPYTWIQATAADGSTVYIPAFK